MIEPAREMVGDEAFDYRGLEESLAAEALRRQRVAREIAQATRQPRGHRHVEAPLLAVDDARRESIGHGTAQEVLRGHAAQTESRRDPAAELHHGPIKER